MRVTTFVILCALYQFVSGYEYDPSFENDVLNFNSLNEKVINDTTTKTVNKEGHVIETENVFKSYTGKSKVHAKHGQLIKKHIDITIDETGKESVIEKDEITSDTSAESSSSSAAAFASSYGGQSGATSSAAASSSAGSAGYGQGGYRLGNKSRPTIIIQENRPTSTASSASSASSEQGRGSGIYGSERPGKLAAAAAAAASAGRQNGGSYDRKGPYRSPYGAGVYGLEGQGKSVGAAAAAVASTTSNPSETVVIIDQGSGSSSRAVASSSAGQDGFYPSDLYEPGRSGHNRPSASAAAVASAGQQGGRRPFDSDDIDGLLERNGPYGSSGVGPYGVGVYGPEGQGKSVGAAAAAVASAGGQNGGLYELNRPYGFDGLYGSNGLGPYGAGVYRPEGQGKSVEAAAAATASTTSNPSETVVIIDQGSGSSSRAVASSSAGQDGFYPSDLYEPGRSGHNRPSASAAAVASAGQQGGRRPFDSDDIDGLLERNGPYGSSGVGPYGVGVYGPEGQGKSVGAAAAAVASAGGQNGGLYELNRPYGFDGLYGSNGLGPYGAGVYRPEGQGKSVEAAAAATASTTSNPSETVVIIDQGSGSSSRAVASSSAGQDGFYPSDLYEPGRSGHNRPSASAAAVASAGQQGGRRPFDSDDIDGLLERNGPYGSSGVGPYGVGVYGPEGQGKSVGAAAAAVASAGGQNGGLYDFNRPYGFDGLYGSNGLGPHGAGVYRPEGQGKSVEAAAAATASTTSNPSETVVIIDQGSGSSSRAVASSSAGQDGFYPSDLYEPGRSGHNRPSASAAAVASAGQQGGRRPFDSDDIDGLLERNGPYGSSGVGPYGAGVYGPEGQGKSVGAAAAAVASTTSNPSETVVIIDQGSGSSSRAVASSSAGQDGFYPSDLYEPGRSGHNRPSASAAAVASAGQQGGRRPFDSDDIDGLLERNGPYGSSGVGPYGVGVYGPEGQGKSVGAAAAAVASAGGQNGGLYELNRPYGFDGLYGSNGLGPYGAGVYRPEGQGKSVEAAAAATASTTSNPSETVVIIDQGSGSSSRAVASSSAGQDGFYPSDLYEPGRSGHNRPSASAAAVASAGQQGGRRPFDSDDIDGLLERNGPYGSSGVGPYGAGVYGPEGQGKSVGAAAAAVASAGGQNGGLYDFNRPYGFDGLYGSNGLGPYGAGVYGPEGQGKSVGAAAAAVASTTSNPSETVVIIDQGSGSSSRAVASSSAGQDGFYPSDLYEPGRSGHNRPSASAAAVASAGQQGGRRPFDSDDIDGLLERNGPYGSSGVGPYGVGVYGPEGQGKSVGAAAAAVASAGGQNGGLYELNRPYGFDGLYGSNGLGPHGAGVYRPEGQGKSVEAAAAATASTTSNPSETVVIIDQGSGSSSRAVASSSAGQDGFYPSDLYGLGRSGHNRPSASAAAVASAGQQGGRRPLDSDDIDGLLERNGPYGSSGVGPYGAGVYGPEGQGKSVGAAAAAVASTTSNPSETVVIIDQGSGSSSRAVASSSAGQDGFYPSDLYEPGRSGHNRPSASAAAVASAGQQGGRRPFDSDDIDGLLERNGPYGSSGVGPYGVGVYGPEGQGKSVGAAAAAVASAGGQNGGLYELNRPYGFDGLYGSNGLGPHGAGVYRPEGQGKSVEAAAAATASTTSNPSETVVIIDQGSGSSSRAVASSSAGQDGFYPSDLYGLGRSGHNRPSASAAAVASAGQQGGRRPFDSDDIDGLLERNGPYGSSGVGPYGAGVYGPEGQGKSVGAAAAAVSSAGGQNGGLYDFNRPYGFDGLYGSNGLGPYGAGVYGPEGQGKSVGAAAAAVASTTSNPSETVVIIDQGSGSSSRAVASSSAGQDGFYPSDLYEPGRSGHNRPSASAAAVASAGQQGGRRPFDSDDIDGLLERNGPYGSSGVGPYGVGVYGPEGQGKSVGAAAAAVASAGGQNGGLYELNRPYGFDGLYGSNGLGPYGAGVYRPEGQGKSVEAAAAATASTTSNPSETVVIIDQGSGSSSRAVASSSAGQDGFYPSDLYEPGRSGHNRPSASAAAVASAGQQGGRRPFDSDDIDGLLERNGPYGSSGVGPYGVGVYGPEGQGKSVGAAAAAIASAGEQNGGLYDFNRPYGFDGLYGSNGLGPYGAGVYGPEGQGKSVGAAAAAVASTTSNPSETVVIIDQGSGSSSRAVASSSAGQDGFYPSDLYEPGRSGHNRPSASAAAVASAGQQGGRRPFDSDDIDGLLERNGPYGSSGVGPYGVGVYGPEGQGKSVGAAAAAVASTTSNPSETVVIIDQGSGSSSRAVASSSAGQDGFYPSDLYESGRSGHNRPSASAAAVASAGQQGGRRPFDSDDIDGLLERNGPYGSSGVGPYGVGVYGPEGQGKSVGAAAAAVASAGGQNGGLYELNRPYGFDGLYGSNGLGPHGAGVYRPEGQGKSVEAAAAATASTTSNPSETVVIIDQGSGSSSRAVASSSAGQDGFYPSDLYEPGRSGHNRPSASAAAVASAGQQGGRRPFDSDDIDGLLERNGPYGSSGVGPYGVGVYGPEGQGKSVGAAAAAVASAGGQNGGLYELNRPYGFDGLYGSNGLGPYGAGVYRPEGQGKSVEAAAAATASTTSNPSETVVIIDQGSGSSSRAVASSSAGQDGFYPSDLYEPGRSGHNRPSASAAAVASAGQQGGRRPFDSDDIDGLLERNGPYGSSGVGPYGAGVYGPEGQGKSVGAAAAAVASAGGQNGGLYDFNRPYGFDGLYGSNGLGPHGAGVYRPEGQGKSVEAAAAATASTTSNPSETVVIIDQGSGSSSRAVASSSAGQDGFYPSDLYGLGRSGHNRPSASAAAVASAGQQGGRRPFDSDDYNGLYELSGPYGQGPYGSSSTASTLASSGSGPNAGAVSSASSSSSTESHPKIIIIEEHPSPSTSSASELPFIGYEGYEGSRGSGVSGEAAGSQGSAGNRGSGRSRGPRICRITRKYLVVRVKNECPTC